MTSKQKIISLSLFLVLAISSLVQLVHNYEHISSQLLVKECHHDYDGKTQLTHDHHNFDHCDVCQFSISNFLNLPVFSFNYVQFLEKLKSDFLFTEQIILVDLNYFSLRAPPSIVA